MKKKDFSPTVYKYKDSVMEHVENSDLFNSYLKTNIFTQLYDGTLWAEGPCYIPHKDMLVWSDNPNNRMMKLVDGQVSEFRNPSNFCNGNTIDNEENLISCSHGGRCVYKTDDNILLLHTNMKAGHGGSSGRFEYLKEIALEYAYIMHLEGLSE